MTKAKYLPFALGLFLLSPSVFAQDYAIRFLRPLKPGDEYKISAAAKQTQALFVTSNDVPKRDDKKEIAVQLDGVEKVIEVDANGKETKIALTVDKFTVTTSGSAADIEPKGTVINSSVVDKKEVHEIDGKAVDHPVARALDMVISLSCGEPTNDEMFGTKERKKPRDSWDVNGDKIKAALELSAGGMEFNGFTGKTWLLDVADGSLVIGGAFTGSVKPPLPPALIIDQSSMEAAFRVTLPVDVTKYAPESAQTVSFSFTAHTDAPTGEKIVIKSSAEQSINRTMTPLK